MQDLGSQDPETKHLAADRLRAEGERALPLLEKAAAGKDAGAARAGFLVQRIQADLTAREREADEAYLRAGSSPLAALPKGAWAVVAQGRLAGSGATREEALAKGAAVAARHRFVWRLGEPVAGRRVEVSSLSAGDLGAAARKALGAGAVRLRAPGGTLEARMESSGPDDWPDAAAALAEPEALRLGMARWEIPGHVEVRSRLGAGVLARAWRARAEGLSFDGTKSCEIEVWAIPAPDLMKESHP